MTPEQWKECRRKVEASRGIPPWGSSKRPNYTRAYRALGKLNKIKSEKQRLSEPLCCISGRPTRRFDLDEHYTILPWEDAQTACLTAYLISIGYLPADKRERLAFKENISNVWPVSRDIRGYLRGNPSSPLLMVPTNVKSLLKGCLRYLQRAEVEHPVDQPWTLDWRELRKQCTSLTIKGHPVYKYTMWFVPGPETTPQSRAFPWTHLVQREDESAEMFYAEPSSGLPLLYKVTNEPWKSYHETVPAANPSCWLFMDPFLASILAVQAISLSGCGSKLNTGPRRLYKRMELLVRLLESPYPSAFRATRMQNALRKVGITVPASICESKNTARRVFHQPLGEVPHTGDFKIPPLAQAPYSMTSIEEYVGDKFYGNVAGIQWMVAEDVQLPLKIDEEDKSKVLVVDTQGGNILKYVPLDTYDEELLNPRIVVDVHKRELWELIWEKIVSRGDSSKDISRQLNRFLRLGAGYIEDGQRLAAQLREEALYSRWCIEGAVQDIMEQEGEE